jgi:hypothetical protein
MNSVWSAEKASSYVVVIEGNKASLKTVGLSDPKAALVTGVGGGALSMSGGKVAILGGLLIANGGCKQGDGSKECILNDLLLLHLDDVSKLSGNEVELTLSAHMSLDAPRFGVAMTALPEGILIAGGQTSIQTSAADVFDDTGLVIIGSKKGTETSNICTSK